LVFFRLTVVVALGWSAGAWAQGGFVARNTRPGGGMLWSIAAGPAGLVAVGDGGTIVTSPDGTAWARQNSGVAEWLVAVTYGAGHYVAVGDRGLVLTSVDGVRWTRQATAANGARLNNVIHAGGRFVAVGEGGAVATSPDGQRWTTGTTGVNGWLRGLAYTRFVYRRFYLDTTEVVADYYVCAGQGGVMLRSADGLRWEPMSAAGASPFGPADLEAVVSTQYGFVAVGQGGQVGFHSMYLFTVRGMFTSLMEASLTYRTGGTERLRGLAAGANALFATGENGAILTAASAQSPWTALNSGTTANLVGGAYIGNSLFVVGDNETILQSAPFHGSRLANLSTRGFVGTGADIMISGLVVSGTAPKTLLVRAAGPALAAFGVGGALAAPVLTMLDGAGRPLASNAGWDSAANAREVAAVTAAVGGFALATGSADAALLVTVPPGAYTLQVAGRGGATGVALVEAYDADVPSAGSARAINVATRGRVGGEAGDLIAGFNIAGPASRRVLIRAVGPTLGGLGVPGALAAPVLELFRGARASATARDPWAAGSDAGFIRGGGLLAGAFALNEEARDVGMVVTLEPGSWTARISAGDGGSGVALVEVYDLP